MFERRLSQAAYKLLDMLFCRSGAVLLQSVERRIGDLEDSSIFAAVASMVERRIGDLEVCFFFLPRVMPVERRMGDLEDNLPDMQPDR